VADQLRPTDPREIGPYRLTGWLGGGGMGEVYLGKSAGGRQVAVKVIRPELAADHEFRTRFRREVAAARRVNGLYTALVAGADTEGPTPWLATAYVPGPSLEAAVEGRGPLPARSVLALAAGLAEGLDAVHAVGLVHRDVKPSNVLLSADGPRLIDFGIAWDAQSTVLTAAGTIYGEPEYMSPEYAAGHRFGPPTDVFSLGGVLVYAAAGRPPFEGSSLVTIIGRIRHEEPDLSAVPESVRPIAAWCLAKDPAERPTPKELLARVGDAGLGDDWLPKPLLADVRASRTAPTSPRRPRKPESHQGRPQRHDDKDTQTIDVGAAAPLTPGAPTVVRGAGQPGTTAERRVQGQAAASASASSAGPSGTPPWPASPGLAEPPGQAQPPSHAGAAAAPPDVVDRAVARPARSRARRPDRSPAGSRPRSAVPRRAVLIGAPAVLAAAAGGAGLWLWLGHHPAGSGTPAASHSARASASSSASASATGRPALGPASPFRFTVSGEIERACSAGLHSVGGRTASVVFADRTKVTTISVYWVNYQGKKSLFVTLKPGASGKISGDVGDVWQLDGPAGCIADFATTAAGQVTVANAKS
jgi:eukaryotic-like serine/threonine-protein kinase